MEKTKNKAILKFKILDKNLWSGDKYTGKECKIFSYDFDGFGKRPIILNVSHNLAWDIYTSDTFENEITAFIKTQHPNFKIKYITFSEMGLQENKMANMDIIY